MMLLGGHVQGGVVHGSWPGLSAAALDDEALAVTTDYRDVVWEVLNQRMDAVDPATVFPSYTPTPLGIIG